MSFVGGGIGGGVVVCALVAISASSFCEEEFAYLEFRGVCVVVSCRFVVLWVVVMFDGVFEFALCYYVVDEGEGEFAVCSCANY